MNLVVRDGVVASDLDDRSALRRAGAFVALTFAIALAVYLPVIASARGLVAVGVPGGLAVLGIFSPALAALALQVYDLGRAGVRATLRPATVWRFGRRWWAVSLLLAPFVHGVTYAAFLLLGGDYEPAPVLAQLDGPLGVGFVPLYLAVTLLLALGEELGWRGYLLPLLQTRFSAAVSSLVLGVVWFLWHVPLRSLPGDANAGFPLPLWGVSIVATTFVYTWLFNNARGSVLAVTVFHGLLNGVGTAVALHPSVTGDPLSAYVIAGGNVVLALVLLARYGDDMVYRVGRPERGPE